MATRRKGLFEGVARELAKRIFAGDVKPGEKLATEFELCGEFGVSRTVIRDALRVLGSKGLIQARPHSGTVVRGIEYWNFLDPQMISWAREMGDREGFFDMLMEARFVFEPAVVEIAAMKATEEEIERIEAACVDMEKAAAANPPANKAFNKADIVYHLALLDATHNLILRQFGGVIKTALLASFEMALEEEEISEVSVKAHRTVVEAIRNRNPRVAREGLEVMTGILKRRVERRQRSLRRSDRPSGIDRAFESGSPPSAIAESPGDD